MVKILSLNEVKIVGEPVKMNEKTAGPCLNAETGKPAVDIFCCNYRDLYYHGAWGKSRKLLLFTAPWASAVWSGSAGDIQPFL
ncbi:hypothetical protein C0033_02730 [Clostridium sp. chh4-2]|nr:hypothetical protein C0033_02730 [Clostridium sp. chh4-2]